MPLFFAKNASTKPPSPLNRANHFMVLIMLFIGVANILFAERLTVNGGFGWDGVRYAAWAKDFYNGIFVVGVPEYYVHRILPSFVVHYGMRLFGVAPEDQNVILAFQILNLILILLSVYVWGQTADELKISTKGKWLGFCFLFLSYPILKHSFYAAVSTDTGAFALGVLMFHFFLTNNRFGMLAVILAGMFTWPTVPCMAALLYVFPYEKDLVPRTPKTTLPPFRLHVIFAAFICLISLLSYAYLLRPQFLAMWLSGMGRELRVDMPLLYVSVAAVILYLFLSLRIAAADAKLFDLRAAFAALRWQRAVLVVVLLAVLKLAVHGLASGEPFYLDFKFSVANTLLTALTEPFIFLVAHTVYYGPFILLLVLLWRFFCDSFRAFGLGFGLFVILNLLLSVGPQSRVQINAAPVFAIVLVRLMDRSGLTYRGLIFLGLLCIFYSKVWYVFNTAPQVDDGTMDALQSFPLQHVFMNFGTWMSHEMYLVQGGIVLVTGILFYFLLRKNLLGNFFLRSDFDLER